MPSRRNILLSTLALTLSSFKTTFLFAAADTDPHPTKPWMDERMSAHLQSVLGFTDQDWQTVSQKVEPVLQLMYQRDRFGRTKIPKPVTDGRTREISSGGDIVAIKSDPGRIAERGSANAELGEAFFRLVTLASQAAPSTGDVKGALADFRNARSRSDAELAQARTSLRELMSFKQEAALVVMGILD
jgi:hypothetical protein